MVKVKFKKINNIVKIEDSENEELKGKKYFIEFCPSYLNFHKINLDKSMSSCCLTGSWYNL